jgi:hypothetical protein
MSFPRRRESINLFRQSWISRLRGNDRFLGYIFGTVNMAANPFRSGRAEFNDDMQLLLVNSSNFDGRVKAPPVRLGHIRRFALSHFKFLQGLDPNRHSLSGGNGLKFG